jgi:hypothetical protein
VNLSGTGESLTLENGQDLTVEGGSGNTITLGTGSSSDTINFIAGTNTVNLTSAQLSSQTIGGGTGIDTIKVTDSGATSPMVTSCA